MTALFNESGQNSSYTRLFADPDGENTIILFKSCFPIRPWKDRQTTHPIRMAG